MRFSAGDRIGRYEVRGTLGAGGMGEVYLARDPDLERDVALKIISDAHAGDDRIRRFVQEAKAASALHHPNAAHIYEIGTHDGIRFMAMELVEGETLRDRIRHGPLPADEVLQIGGQIAAALGAAHAAGIVHRDIKPENAIVQPDGHVKVLDFGLAKLRGLSPDDVRETAATAAMTKAGTTMGTLGYMAPEQHAGGAITPAADVFSLGVVLYEMAAGRRPFEGNTPMDVVTAILTKTPPPIRDRVRDLPPKLESVIARCLAREPAARYASGAEVAEELGRISRERLSAAFAHSRPEPESRRRVWRIAAAVLVVALAGGAAWLALRAKRADDARALIAEAERHLETRSFAAAFEAAVAAEAILPAEARLREVIARATGKATFRSDPPGAAVYLERMGDPAGRARIGTTPFIVVRLPHGSYLVTMEKEGYAPAARPLTRTPLFGRGLVLDPAPALVEARLIEAARMEPDMVRVDGGEYRLVGWQRPSDRAVVLEDFFIDRFEVTNRAFAEFIRDGGYRRRELWKHAFVDGGKTLSFDEAMARFRDTTTLTGPRNWSRGMPPAGLGDHPVTGVTWYEAAAFAAWKGKTLPTIYQWEKAARHPGAFPLGTVFPWGIVPEGDDVTARVNYRGRGTMPVESLPFGMSPWGAHHMAGNVAEWCRNPKAPGYATRGGGWNDAVYSFQATGAFPPLYSSGTLGFRCVREIGRGGGAGEFPISTADAVPEFRPVGDAAFDAIRRRYDYAKGPLAARIVERIERSDWTIERIVYTVNGDEVPALLYLPRTARPPYHVVMLSPGSDVISGWRPLDAAIENWLGSAIRSGRAAFAVMREGYTGRPRREGVEPPDSRSAEYGDYVIGEVTEMRRGLDYLETRDDIDAARLAFFGISAGTAEGLVLAGLEDRYRSVMIMGSSLRERELGVTPAANRINFVPRIGGTKLVLHGRYDETAPWETEGKPLFDLLPEPKRMQLYDGGHVPPFEVLIPTMQQWLDETLGPVAN